MVLVNVHVEASKLQMNIVISGIQICESRISEELLFLQLPRVIQHQLLFTTDEHGNTNLDTVVPGSGLNCKILRILVSVCDSYLAISMLLR